MKAPSRKHARSADITLFDEAEHNSKAAYSEGPASEWHTLKRCHVDLRGHLRQTLASWIEAAHRGTESVLCTPGFPTRLTPSATGETRGTERHVKHGESHRGGTQSFCCVHISHIDWQVSWCLVARPGLTKYKHFNSLLPGSLSVRLCRELGISGCLFYRCKCSTV